MAAVIQTALQKKNNKDKKFILVRSVHKNNWLQSYHDSLLSRKYNIYCYECQTINQVVMTPMSAVLRAVQKHIFSDL